MNFDKLTVRLHFLRISLQEKQAAAAGLLRRVQKQPLQAAYCGAF